LKWCKNNLEKKEVDFEMIQSRNVFISDNFTEDFEKLIGNVNIVKYKEILREYYLMGKNLQSIASQYNVKISMASQMLSSARDKLKTQLEKNQIN
jgi:RNA polymerase sigma factor (sigma-70 family)